MATIQRYLVFFGCLVDTPTIDKLRIEPKGALGVDQSTGRIIGRAAHDGVTSAIDYVHEWTGDSAVSGENIEVVSLAHGQFLMPGLIDTHTHAPQFTFLGIGHDLPLMDWLNKYTFKHESEFKDNQWARKMYTEVINRVVRNGVTFAAYYGTIHVEATCILAEVIRSVGQRAYVGKVCMDANSPDYYSESTAESLEDSKEFVRRILNAETANAHGDQQKGQHIPLIKPIITPRFVPSCTGECLAGLSELAHKHELPIQSHLCENPSEVDFAKSCFPDCTSYSSIYDKHGLLKQGTIMAHCVHMSDEDLRLIRATGAGISHCPNSNFSLASGTADVHRFLSEGIPVGLGTDVGGGYSPSIIDSMRMAAAANRTLLAYKRDRGDFLEGRSAAPLEFSELIFLATQGGAQVMGMRDNLGSLEAGKLFDAIVVDLDVPRSPVPSSTFTPAVIAFGEGSVDAWRLRLEQFVFLADDRNIARVFVNGRLIHSV